MVKSIRIFLLVAFLAFGLTQNSQADLFDVSPNLTVAAPGIPAGFPVWYQDFSGPATRADANPNYGIGPTPGGLQLELCPDPVGVPGAPCISSIADDEFFWWTADATLNIPASGALATPGLAQLIQATEGTTAAAPIVFSRTRIRVDTPVAGTYTVTFPFGVKVFNAPAGVRGINDTIDAGCLAAPCNFRLALTTEHGPFLFWDTGLPILNNAGVAGDNFFIGDAATPHKVLGSPFGTNFFRIDGPPGSNLDPNNLDGDGNPDSLSTDLFVVSGKVFTAGGAANTAPVAVPDAAATLAVTPVVIDVLANDTFTDVPINPGSLAITAQVGGTAVKTVIDGRVKVTYTPDPGFNGDGSFTYTIENFASTPTAPRIGTATVTVTVEDLKVNKAEFRPKFLKWRITGTSSDATANTIGIQSGPSTVSTTLSGANEVPPQPANPAKTGTASVTVGEGSINFTLSISGLLNVTSTHLHLGTPGTNGQVLFTLAGANVTSVPAGTLTAADLDPAAGISFADAVNAILGGNTYVQVHTAAVPAGEIRGQLGPNRLVGSATVQANGIWSLDGKSLAFPDDARTITVRSSNGVRVIDMPLKIK